MRTLATTAIEAATHAGAQFADIRISELREYSPAGFYYGELMVIFGYGIRVRVNDCDAFVCGVDPTREGVIRATQTAIAAARDQAKVSGRGWPLVPTPVVKGEWTSPVKIDPFAISPEDHVVVQNGLRLWEGRKSGVSAEVSGMAWQGKTQVFASSEGSLVTQRTTRVHLFDGAYLRYSNWRPDTEATILVPGIDPQTAGVEALLGDALHAHLEAAVDDFAQLMTYPLARAEVGRKDIVLDGHAFGTVLGYTVVPALMLGRALGEEQDSEGTSFLAPPAAIVGQALFAPALNLWVESAVPYYGAAQWDDEGVATRTVPLIEGGVVQRYLGTRASAGACTLERTTPSSTPAGASDAPASTAGSTLGVAFTSNALSFPAARPGTLAVRTVSPGPSLAELARMLRNGYLLRNGSAVIDQQGAGGALIRGLLFEVRDGEIRRRLIGARLEFSTKKLLRTIPALGGSSSVATASHFLTGGLPWNATRSTLRAPAVILKDVNIVTQ